MSFSKKYRILDEMAHLKSTIALSVCFIRFVHFGPLFGPVFRKVKNLEKSLSGATVEENAEKYRKSGFFSGHVCGGSYIRFSSMFCTTFARLRPVFKKFKKVKKVRKRVEKWSSGQIQTLPKYRIKSARRWILKDPPEQGLAQYAP